jgi:hypothetical protein
MSRPAVAVPAEMAWHLQAALSIVLDRPENTWARNFILRPGENPAGDVAMLSNPVHLSHAVVMEATHVGVCSPRAPPHARTDRAGHGHLQAVRSATTESVLVPAWTSGHITVGAFVQTMCAVNCSQPHSKAPTAARVGRFIRDDSSSKTTSLSLLHIPMIAQGRRRSACGM